MDASTVDESMYTTYPNGPQCAEHARNTSDTYKTELRKLFLSTVGVTELPVGCRAICRSSWVKFSAVNANHRSDEDMKASVLCAGRGRIAGCNQPAAEFVPLPVYQAPQENPVELRFAAKNRTTETCRAAAPRQFKPTKEIQNSAWITLPSIISGSSSSSSKWSSHSSSGSTFTDDTIPLSMSFPKQCITKPASTKSLLTSSLEPQTKAGSKKGPASPMENVVNALGFSLTTLDLSQLPSAFDSDSEDEEE